MNRCSCGRPTPPRTRTCRHCRTLAALATWQPPRRARAYDDERLEHPSPGVGVEGPGARAWLAANPRYLTTAARKEFEL